MTELKVKKIGEALPIFYFLISGGGSMVGWHAILNSFDYFDTKYSQSNVSFSFPIAIYVAQFLSSILMTKISSFLMFNVRVIASFFLITLILAFLPFEAVLFKGTDLGFWFLMSLLFILGFSCNICLSSVVGLASQLPGKYTTCIFIGSSFVGLFMSVLRETASLIFQSTSSDDIYSMAVFFVVAALLILVSAMTQPIFTRSAFYKIYLLQPEKAALDSEKAVVFLKTQRTVERTFSNFWETLKEVKLPLLLMAVAYIQLFTVFPGVMEEKSTPGIPNQIKVVTMTVAFTLANMIGKFLGQQRKYYNLCTAGCVVIFRFVLINLFMLQAATTTIPVLDTIWFGYLNIAIFGITTGFLTVSLCILGPEFVEIEKKEIAGFLSVLAINVGTMIGTFTALPFEDLL